jgi:hypothetical protein
VIGPSSGGGGGGGGGSTIDPTTILGTGDIKARYGTGALVGFVRTNGLSIGNATSGATERANADTQNLFIYLYNADPNLSVSGGRTGIALNDYNANKTIALPDWRGRAMAGLDDMGSTAAGRLTATYFGTAATALGASGGSQTGALTSVNQFPPYTPSGGLVGGTNQIPTTPIGVSTTSNNVPVWQASAYGSVPILSEPAFQGTAVGASAPFAVASPMMLTTFYMKL